MASSKNSSKNSTRTSTKKTKKATKRPASSSEDKENNITKITTNSTIADITKYVGQYMSAKCHETLANLLANHWKSLGM